VGMLAIQLLPADAVEAAVAAAKDATTGPVGVTFLMPYFDRSVLDAAAATADLVDFFYADPDRELVEVVHRAGKPATWQVGSVAEAIAAREAGCDAITVQGTEAGGRIRGTTALLPLLTQTLEQIDVPVIAAGGIAGASGVTAVLAAGAAAARVGTRFLATPESGAHPVYVAALLEASAEDTVITDRYESFWPGTPKTSRVLRSALASAAALDPSQPVASMALGPRRLEVQRYHVAAPNRSTEGEIEAMALYAGQSVGAVHRVQPAAEVLAELAPG
jgi:nitronate monooxygenase